MCDETQYVRILLEQSVLVEVDLDIALRTGVRMRSHLTIIIIGRAATFKSSSSS